MWRCQGHNCGYTYDPAKGDKRGKIPRGSPSRTSPKTGSAPAAVPARRCSRNSTADLSALVSGHTPLIPGVNDAEEHLRATLELIRPHKNVVGYVLLPSMRFGESKYGFLGRVYEMQDFEPPSP